MDRPSKQPIGPPWMDLTSQATNLTSINATDQSSNQPDTDLTSQATNLTWTWPVKQPTWHGLDQSSNQLDKNSNTNCTHTHNIVCCVNNSTSGLLSATDNITSFAVSKIPCQDYFQLQTHIYMHTHSIICCVKSSMPGLLSATDTYIHAHTQHHLLC